MPSVVLLRGVNVGGHRTFRPAQLAVQLKHLEPVNIGAAGTMVIHRSIAPAALRAELARRLPFETEIMICRGSELVRALSHASFADYPARPDVVRFVTVLSRIPRPGSSPALPLQMPERGPWLLKVLARDGRVVVGVYRRHMKVVRYLGTLDRLFGVPATTRNWNTVAAIAKAIGEGRRPEVKGQRSEVKGQR